MLPALGATADQTAELEAGLTEVRAAVVTVGDTAQLVKMLIETGSQLLG